MAGETTITVIGNATADPELRYTASGVPCADFTIASTPRVFDRTANEWRDGETLFLRCSAWREMAENTAETIRKGMRIIVVGRLAQRTYDTKQGERRTTMELQVDEVGPSLRRATAQVTRTGMAVAAQAPNRSQEPAGRANSPRSTPTQDPTWNAPQGGSHSDPWATSGPAPF